MEKSRSVHQRGSYDRERYFMAMEWFLTGLN